MGRLLGLAIDPRKRDPLYQQIFEAIASRIRAGTFPAGHRLPPTRSLAAEIGAHRNTVVRAYENLETAGFVVSTVGRGTFVAQVGAGNTGAREHEPVAREIGRAHV